MDWTITQLVIIGTALACISMTENKSLWITLCVISFALLHLVQTQMHTKSHRSSSSGVVSSMQTNAKKPERKMTPNPYLKQTKSPATGESISLLETTYEPLTSPLSGNEWFEREQQRYESQVFHGGVATPSQDSRMRLLRSMYDELEATNVKRDPYLSATNPNDPGNTSDTDCQPLRGSHEVTYNWTHM